MNKGRLFSEKFRKAKILGIRKGIAGANLTVAFFNPII
jgi:hypothetical protein